MHVVTSWLGNTPKIAMKHYLMRPTPTSSALQNAVQHLTEMASQDEETPADPTAE